MWHFRCPYCDRDQAVTSKKAAYNFVHFDIEGNAEGEFGAQIVVTGCANPQCRKSTVDLELMQALRPPNSNWRADQSKPKLFSQRVLPRGSARQYPDFIPMPLREDYNEACLIRDLSPKASATLVRRCIQGMIRDFCGITKPTLAKEIEALKAAVEAGQAPQGVTIETVDAIDHVRGIGNIGAHMERDIDKIIPVEADEAGTLISLVEMLFEEWYIARFRREEKLASIKKIAAAKENAKRPDGASNALSQAIPLPPEDTP